MFGQHEHTLDSKNRVTMPKDLRGPLVNGLVLTRGYDRCVCVYPPDAWDELKEYVERLPQLSESVRRFRRLFLGGAVRTNLDSLGRVIVPGHLQEYARIQKKVTIVGLGTTIEIWPTEIYREEMIVDTNEAQSIIESVMNLGLTHG